MEKQQLERLKNRIIDKEGTIISALKQMDAIDRKLLFVFDAAKFVGILSIGDIQRALIRNLSLETPVKNILRRQVLTASETEIEEDIRKTMISNRVECMPVLNPAGDLVRVYFWEDLFGNETLAAG